MHPQSQAGPGFAGHLHAENERNFRYVHISVKTVEKHRANIMNKLDLRNAAALTAYAIEHDLVTKKGREV